MRTPDSPLVSVLIPVHNAQDLLAEAVRSILHQTFVDLEILICDDFSTDGTAALMRTFGDTRIRCFFNESNIGSLRTRNRLAGEARGVYIAWQDADDISHPGRIAQQVAFLEQHPEIGVCGTNFCRRFSSTREVSVSNYPLTDAAIRQEVARGTVPFCAPSTMIRSSLLARLGGMREFFAPYGWYDFDLILRAGEASGLANLPGVLYEYRYLPGSQSRDIQAQTPEKLFVAEIGFFLRDQRLSRGADSLMSGGDEAELRVLVADLRRRAHSDPGLSYVRKCRNYISNRDYARAFLAARKAWALAPLSTRSYALVARAFASWVKTRLTRPFRAKPDSSGWRIDDRT